MVPEHLVIAERQNNAMRRRFTTHESAYTYKIGQIKSLNGIIYILIWAYFILAAIYLGILLIGPKSESYSFYYKLCVLIVLVIYPYVITPFLMFIYRLIVFIIESAIGNVFSRPDYQYVIDRSYIPNLFKY